MFACDALAGGCWFGVWELVRLILACRDGKRGMGTICVGWVGVLTV